MTLSPTGWAVWLLLAFAASAQALVHPVRRGTLRHQPAMAAEEENEESKEILGAAALGAISAIAVTDEVGMGIITAAAFAYGATMANGAGKAARVGGRAVFKAYETGIDINEKYEVMEKTKGAVDNLLGGLPELSPKAAAKRKAVAQKQVAEAAAAASAAEMAQAEMRAKAEAAVQQAMEKRRIEAEAEARAAAERVAVLEAQAAAARQAALEAAKAAEEMMAAAAAQSKEAAQARQAAETMVKQA